MTSLDKPATVPALRPIAEYRADSELTAIYEDVKRTLGVPWVGVVVQALAYYRPFFDRACTKLLPALGSQYVERVATDLRLLAYQEISEGFPVADQAASLRDSLGYSQRELDEIRQLIDIFDYGNPKYFILATIVKEGLVGEEAIGGVQPSDPSDLLPRSPVRAAGDVPPMLEEHHADRSLRELYEEMKSALDLPFVNSDYKAMARWPTYLELAWRELKPALDTEVYRDVRRKLNDRCVAAAHSLPYSYRLGRGELETLGMSTAEMDELADVVRLFQWLLSGLILNVTHFKIAMNRGDGTSPGS